MRRGLKVVIMAWEAIVFFMIFFGNCYSPSCTGSDENQFKFTTPAVSYFLLSVPPSRLLFSIFRLDAISRNLFFFFFSPPSTTQKPDTFDPRGSSLSATISNIHLHFSAILFFRYFKTFQAPIGIRQEREAVFWNCYRHFREKEEEGRRKKSPGPGKMYIKPNAASAAAAKHTAIRENEMRTAISCTKAQRQGLLLDLGNPTRSWPCRGKYCGPTCTYVSRNGTNHRQYLIQVLYFDDEGLKYILFKPRNDGKAHGAFEDLSKRI